MVLRRTIQLLIILIGILMPIRTSNLNLNPIPVTEYLIKENNVIKVSYGWFYISKERRNKAIDSIYKMPEGKSGIIVIYLESQSQSKNESQHQ